MYLSLPSFLVYFSSYVISVSQVINKRKILIDQMMG